MNRTSQPSPWPLGILCLIGLIFLVAVVFVGSQQAFFVFHARRATATFQGAVAHSGGNHGGTFLYPQFRFTTSDGQGITFTSRNGSTNQPYDDGEMVQVLYDPGNPSHAVLDSFWSLWTPTVFLSFFVLGFGGLPYLIWRKISPQ